MRKLTCQEVLDQLAEYLDDDARTELVAQVDLHIGSCKNCRVDVDRIKCTIKIYHCDERVVLPAQLDEQLRLALAQAYLDRGCSEPPDEDGV